MNPQDQWSADFKSAASTDFATSALPCLATKALQKTVIPRAPGQTADPKRDGASSTQAGRFRSTGPQPHQD
ncbi:hypothetical protein AGR8A_Cc40462 [Agrobacterium fabrum str. J-07]|nr:hypothetical protein AGR8A_Cc40462 [Agrobacterium fabrum str. J-07]